MVCYCKCKRYLSVTGGGRGYVVNTWPSRTAEVVLLGCAGVWMCPETN